MNDTILNHIIKRSKFRSTNDRGEKREISTSLTFSHRILLHKLLNLDH